MQNTSPQETLRAMNANIRDLEIAARAHFRQGRTLCAERLKTAAETKRRHARRLKASLQKREVPA